MNFLTERKSRSAQPKLCVDKSGLVGKNSE